VPANRSMLQTAGRAYAVPPTELITGNGKSRLQLRPSPEDGPWIPVAMPTFRDLSHVGDAVARVEHQRCAALDGRWRLAGGNALELVRRVRPCPDL